MQWFKNLNARPRLMLGFGVLILISSGISIFAIMKLAASQQNVKDMYNENLQGSVAADNLEIARLAIGRQVRDALLNINNPQIVAEDEKLVLQSFQDYHANLDAAQKDITSVTECLPLLSAIREATPEYEKDVRQMLGQLRARDSAAAEQSLSDALRASKDMTAQNDKIEELLRADGESMNREVEQAYHFTRTMMIVTALVSAALGVLMAFGIARGFSGPLGKAVHALEQVAAGDLTASLDIDTRDEVGRMATALNNALEKLRSTLEEVSQGAMNASAASQQLAAASQAIASGAQEQAASLEETSASLEEITATVRQSADNARQASQLASGSRDAAEQGQAVVSNAVTAMAEINAASAKISDIISTIDEIAFQTNLLAVNAAVEAARAGEEGRGFAVVAAEVRSLAQRSAEAAKEIKALIQDSLRKVERGTDLVNKSGETLQGIVSSVKRVTDIVGEIAAAAGEQSTGIEQVNTAMTQMDQVTQSNSAQTEELSSTAESLSDQSHSLMELVKTFTLSRDKKPAYAAVATPRHSVAAAASETTARKGFMPRAMAAARRVAQPAGKLQPAPAAAHAGAETGDGSFQEF
ncbi:MAG: methyl-accepting chemotaxis protein [Acidobacteriota bacterium]